MRIRIQLSEEDAKRLETPRDLVFDADRMMGRELMALEEQAGWDVEKLEAALAGEPATNAIGEPVWETDDKGKVKLDGGGKPIRARTLKIATIFNLTWLAAFRSGCTVPYAEFDFDVTGADFIPEEEPGKAPTSPATTTTGKRRSPRSSATRRGSSATA